jgi:uncharacterized membrane protein
VSHDEAKPEPARRQHREPYTVPLIFLAAVIVPQVLVPAQNRVGPDWEVPVAEFIMLALLVLIAARPGPVPRGARPLLLVLCGLLVLANIVAATRLVQLVLTQGRYEGAVPSANRLLIAGAMVLATNIVTFGLLYWQLDGGGPAGRVSDSNKDPDFSFPQSTDPASSSWIPKYFDYFYVAYTNVVAFSPTDTNPMSHRAKALMLVQSMVSLGVIVVVLARVINILPTT